MSIEETGLTGQRLAVLDDTHQVATALAQTTGSHHGDVGRMSVDLGDVLAQSARGGTCVDLRLDNDATTHDVQSAGEPQHRGHLGLAAARPCHHEVSELVLHSCGHGHRARSCH
jgi:hypothetical protein